jgi:tetratricopeptide (TPR) repeat protein
MKTHTTLVMTMAAALVAAAPAGAGQQTETRAIAAAAARATADAARQSQQQALEAARAVAGTIQGQDVQQALELARETLAAQGPQIAQAVTAAREAATVWGSPDVQLAVSAARDAATVWGQQGRDTWLSAAVSAGSWGQESERDREAMRAQREKDDAQREKERAQRDRERENSYYDQGQNALDSARWDRAVSSFDRVAELKGNKADAALYWKAYAQNKLGQRPEALATIGSLQKDYPKSRYISDAKALEVEVKGRTGQPVNPADESDEDMKLMALNALQNSDDAIPILQKMLQGTNSPRIKSRALFVLAQSSSPKAREVLVNIAKGGSNPDLQMKAVQYLGIHGGPENRTALADIYAQSSDVDLKKRILNSFMVAGDRDRLLKAAQSEQNPELRATAVQQLGVMGAHEELWSLYQKESSVDVKKQIIRAMFTGGDVTRLSQLAKSEQNPELRLLAVRNLGLMGSKRTSDTLMEIYSSDKDPEVKKAVINSLFISNNAEGLVGLARKESDPTMKKEMVSKLSNMHSKAATDYLIELLNK